ncbi:MSCRAMM family adhesin SdrC, partial [Myxococcota bacterium]|nr:MSCRAMM family adhesin SdrC [Myxococcota bacterium]
MRRPFIICLFFSLLLFSACDNSGSHSNLDAGPDAQMDSGTDVVGDADADSDGGPEEPANVDSPLAINLGSVSYYSRQWTFLDQTKH